MAPKNPVFLHNKEYLLDAICIYRHEADEIIDYIRNMVDKKLKVSQMFEMLYNRYKDNPRLLIYAFYMLGYTHCFNDIFFGGDEDE